MVTKEDVIEVLKTCYDPVIPINIMAWVVDLIGVFLIAHLGKKPCEEPTGFAKNV